MFVRVSPKPIFSSFRTNGKQQGFYSVVWLASSGWIKRLLDNATLSWGAVRVPGEVLHHTFEKEKKDDSQDQRKQ